MPIPSFWLRFGLRRRRLLDFCLSLPLRSEFSRAPICSVYKLQPVAADELTSVPAMTSSDPVCRRSSLIFIGGKNSLRPRPRSRSGSQIFVLTLSSKLGSTRQVGTR